METKEFEELRKMVIKQLHKYNVRACDHDDYVSEVYLYILNRKGVVDVNDAFIYGDIQNGIIDFMRKENRHNHYEITERTHNKGYYSDSGFISLIELEDMVLDYEYGYLFIDHYIYDISVDNLCDKYNISKNKIYYELNKIKDELFRVY